MTTESAGKHTSSLTGDGITQIIWRLFDCLDLGHLVNHICSHVYKPHVVAAKFRHTVMLPTAV